MFSPGVKTRLKEPRSFPSFLIYPVHSSNEELVGNTKVPCHLKKEVK